MATVEFYTDSKNEFRWRVTANNGEIIGASTEGYRRRDHASNNFKSLGQYITTPILRIAAKVEERTLDSKLPLEFYRDNANEWRWRVTAGNGEIIHASSEGYVALEDARQNLETLVAFIQTA